MATTYKSIPLYLSGFAILTGYTCPANKTAIIKQISLSNETANSGVVDIKWEENNQVGIGTTLVGTKGIYPLLISGIVSGYSVRTSLQEFVAIKATDSITARTPTTGRINCIFTIMEQDVLI